VDDDDRDLAFGRAFRAVLRREFREVLSEMPATNGDGAALVSVNEAAQRLGLGRTKVNELITARKYPHRLPSMVGHCSNSPRPGRFPI
jgi:hypothetical protein